MSIITLDQPPVDPSQIDLSPIDLSPIDLSPVDQRAAIDPPSSPLAPASTHDALERGSASRDADPLRAAGLRAVVRRSIAAVLTALVLLGAFVDTVINRLIDRATASDRRRLAGQRGQATTEYALVLLGAALVALLLVAWATAGGGAARINRLFNRVIDAVVSRV